MTSTEAPEGVAVLTDRDGVTGKTARKSASFALNATDVGLALPHPASSPAASTSSSTNKAPVPLVTPGDYDNLPGAPRRPRRKSGPGIRRPPSGWTSWRTRKPSPVATTIEPPGSLLKDPGSARSEEHTSELQSHSDLVCRLLLEKKKTNQTDR